MDVNGWQRGRLVSICQKQQFICGGPHRQRRNADATLDDEDDDDDNHLLRHQIAVFFTTMTNHGGISELLSPFVRSFDWFC